MRKMITAALAALTLGGAVAGAAAPASAAGWHGGGWGHGYGYRGGWHGGWGWGGGALLAGVAGLAVGAAIADNHPYYGGGYYPGPYAYGGPYATCYGRRDVWDPYMGRYVIERVPYAC